MISMTSGTLDFFCICFPAISVVLLLFRILLHLPQDAFFHHFSVKIYVSVIIGAVVQLDLVELLADALTRLSALILLELTALFERAGLRVLHDREIYDYPSYTGSYSRSGEAVARYLQEYPGIAVVLDIHRDALGTDGVIYKTMAEEEGTVSSQIMLLVGTDASGLEHPNWRSNLALALYLQEAAGRKHPTLMRPVELVAQRYNQHLTTGSLILEVGSSGNTLQEALAAIRLFADAAAPALLELAESPAEPVSNS